MASQSSQKFCQASRAIFILIIIVLMLNRDSDAAENPTPVIDSNITTQTLPNRFFLLAERLTSLDYNVEGLSGKNLSGSGQFSPSELTAILEILKTHQVLILDLREECHGFVNETAVSWYDKENAENRGYPLEKILSIENARLAHLTSRQSATFYHILEKEEGIIQKIMPLPMFVKKAYSEEKLCQKYRISYMRLPITDHGHMKEADIAQFLHLLDTTAETHIHVHCRGGKGRTALIFALYDMYFNAKKFSFDELIERQKHITRYNLLGQLDQSHWKYRVRKSRGEFLKQFYQTFRSAQDHN